MFYHNTKDRTWIKAALHPDQVAGIFGRYWGKHVIDDPDKYKAALRSTLAKQHPNKPAERWSQMIPENANIEAGGSFYDQITDKIMLLQDPIWDRYSDARMPGLERALTIDNAVVLAHENAEREAIKHLHKFNRGKPWFRQLSALDNTGPVTG